jgi:hypothetical protein
MLRTLLAKDLRRASRNPVPWLISLGVPFLITALIGLAFGPSSSGGGGGRVKLGLVDEDDSTLTRFLLGGLNQQEAGKYMEPYFLKRAEALAQIDANKLAGEARTGEESGPVGPPGDRRGTSRHAGHRPQRPLAQPAG